MTTMKNDNPLTAKQAARPIVETMPTPTPGPSTRERLNCVELSAMAFGRSRRGTSDGISA